MKYHLNGTWCNDDTVTALPVGATAVPDWETRLGAGVITPKTVLALDTEKYLRRANIKPLLMAKMAAMNVGRLKSGTWTMAQLVSLMSEDATKSLIDHMETLSFDLAIGVVNSHPNVLLTPAIKSTWVAELSAAL